MLLYSLSQMYKTTLQKCGLHLVKAEAFVYNDLKCNK